MAALLWQRLSHTQELLARQSAETRQLAEEARRHASLAQASAQTLTTRQGLSENSLADLQAWRRQTDELLQTAMRVRDDSLIADLAAMLQAAQIHARLSGSAAPLQAALHVVCGRIRQAAIPLLTGAERACQADLERVQTSEQPDVAALLAQLDRLWQQVDTLPTAADAPADTPANAPANTPTDPPADSPAAATPADAAPKAPAANASANAPATWWQSAWATARQLVQVTRIEQPDALMMAPAQSFFVRQHLKQRLQGARLALLAGHRDAALTDLARAGDLLAALFDAQARATHAARALLQDAQSQLRAEALPQADATLAALAAAAAAASAADAPPPPEEPPSLPEPPAAAPAPVPAPSTSAL